jgi:uncharacterized protein (DUF305 family)
MLQARNAQNFRRKYSCYNSREQIVQINIDKKTGILGTIILVLVGVIIAMSATSKDHNGFFGMGHSSMMGSDQKNNSGDLTGADIMFLQMMIPHHQQAVDISNLALTKSKDAELLALATAIRDGQADEIVLMKKWLKEAGAGLEMGHSMHDQMGGMLDEAELAGLKSATGSEFDRLWLLGMTGHHDGALHMTQMIEDATNSTIKKFGQDIVALQTAQIEQMKVMLQRIK